jgi:hypothetical protein
VDPVNFDRHNDFWRKPGFDYVARLARFRTAYEALAVNDTAFIHVDFHEGKRVLVWQRGHEGSGKLAVVVANFSDFGTPQPLCPRLRVWGAPLAPDTAWEELARDHARS